MTKWTIPASAWQPIETAPRDGHGHHADRDVDLWRVDQGRVANCFWRSECSAWFARSGGRASNMGGDDRFTHWMAIPQPPEADT